MAFNLKYFSFAIVFFAVEVVIALYVHDHFVRPYLGDFLVVILMYCFLKSFFEWRVIKAAVFVLLFSYGIEMLQYLNVIEMLGFEKSAIARTIIGHSFSWIDILAYTAGIFTVIGAEYFWCRNNTTAGTRC